MLKDPSPPYFRIEDMRRRFRAPACMALHRCSFAFGWLIDSFRAKATLFAGELYAERSHKYGVILPDPATQDFHVPNYWMELVDAVAAINQHLIIEPFSLAPEAGLYHSITLLDGVVSVSGVRDDSMILWTTYRGFVHH